ncbi:MAG: response regulator [Spirochaetales bacterium]|nr:response regulator [Spirochaetales bacterium]
MDPVFNEFPLLQTDDRLFVTRLLLATGDRDFVEGLYASFLKSGEYRLETAVDREGILSHFRNRGPKIPDILIIDAGLPGGPVDKICTEVRKEFPKTVAAIIAVVSGRETDEIRALYESGVNDCMTKPFSHEELILRIKAQAEILHLRKKETMINHQLARIDSLITLGEALSGIMHEIGNVISVIKIDTRLLRNRFTAVKGVLDEYLETRGDFPVGSRSYSAVRDRHHEVYERILRNISRITKLADSIKAFAKKESMRGEEVVIADVVKEAYKLCRHKARKSCVRWRKKIPKNLPPVPGNFQFLLQAMVNLFINAIEAADKPDPFIGVTLHYQKRAALMYIIIEDNGRGIEEQYRKRIFEPFFTTKQAIGGTGLGLPLVLKIIERHDGVIRIESEQGEGTIVTIIIPAAKT